MRIGCLGAARIAPGALINPAKVRGGAVLQAVAARDPSRAEAFAREHGFKRAAADYAELIASPDIDLIYNALPIHLHAEWCIRALEAGKHVLCEKPFAMNADEAARVLDAATAASRRVIEAFHYRYHPGFQQVLDWIDAGEIGEVQTIDAAFNVPIADRDGAEIRHLPETGGGAFMDLGCYPLSWTLAVLRADPINITAQARLTPRGVDESMNAKLFFQGGAIATLQSSMAADQAFTAVLTITGPKGRITYRNPLAPQLGASLALQTTEREMTIQPSRIATYVYQLDTVLTALTGGECLPTEGEGILRQQRAIDGVYAAAGLRGLRYR